MEFLREQVRLAEEQLEVQNGYYRQLQENILTVNQIRHDLTNQLQAAYVLMGQGEQQHVSRQLDQIKEQIRNRIGPRFCENLMVDAVLSEKARLCRERGIELDINAQLPAELPIENVYLCSAFANLLDNSINACRTEPKQIRMQAALQGDYLLIRCTNPSAPPDPGKGKSGLLRPHGLGLDILRKIAENYHGSLDTTYRDGIFAVDLILKCTD